MAVYVVYSYQFSPVFRDSLSLFPEDNNMYSESWENKQLCFGKAFDKSLAFKYRNSIYHHELLYNDYNLIVLRLANNKQIVQESEFVTRRLQHNPSCLILVDNRKDVQNIYIESNEYSFSDTDVVRNIFEKSLNANLKSYGLRLSVQHRYQAGEFWSIVESASKGIGMVRFSMQYPNLPSVRAKIDEVLSETSRELHSKATNIEFNAGEGESLVLSKSNEKIKDLVQASADTGSGIVLRIKGFRKLKHVGDTIETVEIENLEASLSSDLLNTAPQKLLDIIDRFKR